MRLAARITDTTLHGGKIITGLPQVLIGDQPAARVDDTQACPVTDTKPHFGGKITTGEPTVIFGDRRAARIGDFCVCGQIGAAGANVSPIFGIPMTDRDGDGTDDTFHTPHNSVGGSISGSPFPTFEQNEETNKFDPNLPHTGKYVGKHIEGEYEISGHYSSVKGRLEVELDTVEVANEKIILADGHGRYGLGATCGAGLNAVAVGGDVTATQFGTEVEIGSRLSWGVGVGFGVMAYYDSNDGKIHLYGCFGLWDAIPVLGQLPITQWLPTVEYSLAIGFAPPPDPPSLNMIVTGEATVIIGD